jgi:hypothetical protein
MWPFLRRVRESLSALPRVQFVYIATRPNHTELVDGETALFESGPTSEEKSGMKRRGGKKAALAAPKDGKSFRISPRPSS